MGPDRPAGTGVVEDSIAAAAEQAVEQLRTWAEEPVVGMRRVNIQDIRMSQTVEAVPDPLVVLPQGSN